MRYQISKIFSCSFDISKLKLNLYSFKSNKKIYGLFRCVFVRHAYKFSMILLIVYKKQSMINAMMSKLTYIQYIGTSITVCINNAIRYYFLFIIGSKVSRLESLTEMV